MQWVTAQFQTTGDKWTEQRICVAPMRDGQVSLAIGARGYLNFSPDDARRVAEQLLEAAK